MSRWVNPLLWVALVSAVPAALASGPFAEWPEMSFDAQNVQLGEVIDHVFVVKNKGDAPLKILEVHNSCGCTVTDYPSVVEPGKEGQVKARIKTETLQTGRQSKTVTVITDAPNLDRVVLQVKFNLVTALEFIPKSTVYIPCKSGEEKIEQVLVRPHRPGMKVTRVVSDNPVLQVRFELVKPEEAKQKLDNPRLPQAGDYWVTLRIPPEAPVGQHKAKITVKTSDPGFPEGQIVVTASVRPVNPEES